MSTPIVLIIGAGQNVGASVARKFAANGFKVAVASRTPQHVSSESQYLHTVCDLKDPSSVQKVFDNVRDKLGEPSVVVYNAAAHVASPSPEAPLDLALSDMQSSTNINVLSAYAAAQEAVQSFGLAPVSQSKVFIYTGNFLNERPIVPFLSLGVGKSATAHMIEYLSKVYQQKEFKFFYADERTPEGSPAFNNIDGQAHADFFWQLVNGSDNIPWLATFAKGQGYTKFSATS